jgi:arylsulfatase A-like enzyme
LTILMIAGWALSACAGAAPARPTITPSPTASASATVTSSPSPTSAPTATHTPSPTPRPTPERVVVISLDGLRPDALSPERTPVIWNLGQHGAMTLSAKTVVPSATLQAHGSMLSGYDISHHGLTWNDYIPSRGYIRTPTLFSLTHDAGWETVMVVSDQKLEHIALPGSVDRFRVDPGGDFSLAAAAIEEIERGFGVLFIHFPGPDAAGHEYGWMSPTYLGTVAHTDEAVGRVLDALSAAVPLDRTLIVLTADHGGHGKVHGSSLADDVTIPWIIAGPGVVPGRQLSVPVAIQDTTPTILWAMGIPIPTDMDGFPVLDAFSVNALSCLPKVPFPQASGRGKVLADVALGFAS